MNLKDFLANYVENTLIQCLDIYWIGPTNICLLLSYWFTLLCIKSEMPSGSDMPSQPIRGLGKIQHAQWICGKILPHWSK